MELEEHIIESACGEFSRKIWLLEAFQGVSSHAAIFLDGEYYVHRMEASSLLERLQQDGSIPPTHCVFISHVDGLARQQDLICNPRYSQFVARDVMRWLSHRYGQVADHDHLIAGTSLGGLAAAFLALTYPNVFSKCLSHSGSFWWNDEWLKNNLANLPHSQAKFWLSVGDRETESGVTHPPTGLRQEVAQVPACERFAEELVRHDHEVHYNLYQGGHEIAPWERELGPALTWLLRDKPPESNPIAS